ncbi:PadR family transcriptional regulator [Bacillus horti]|uniref:DNA-binding PadR family transcriptional regulator n=1 Tax=Caldalkalibacillus horti TaxID=77523 RepID=A0ABT9W0Y0_9BACI|nr:PadR family transcriptional regulator [Bacillus horti]MDQ0166744.1 DNA-binding PadR family transcriptional regulator [Bacillus horti]
MQLQAKYVVLGLLYKRSMSGYDMKKQFEKYFTYFFDASYGSVYPTLTKLEQDNCIVKHTIIQEDKPNKHEYEITSTGRELFEEYLNSPVLDDSIRADLCVRLFFGEFASKETVLKWMNERIKKNETIVAELQEEYERIKSEMSVTQEITIQIGIDYHRAQADTLRKGLKLLDQDSST